MGFEEAALSEILDSRNLSANDKVLETLLESEAVTECFGEDEVKLLESWKTNQKKHVSSCKEYKQRCADFKKSVANKQMGTPHTYHDLARKHHRSNQLPVKDVIVFLSGVEFDVFDV